MRLVFYGVGQRAFVLKDLSQVSTVHPAATCWATHEMLGFVLGWNSNAPADVLAARDVDHCCAVASIGNTVN